MQSHKVTCLELSLLGGLCAIFGFALGSWLL